jgi:hypothetical protein
VKFIPNFTRHHVITYTNPTGGSVISFLRFFYQPVYHCISCTCNMFYPRNFVDKVICFACRCVACSGSRTTRVSNRSVDCGTKSDEKAITGIDFYVTIIIINVGYHHHQKSTFLNSNSIFRDILDRVNLSPFVSLIMRRNYYYILFHSFQTGSLHVVCREYSLFLRLNNKIYIE